MKNLINLLNKMSKTRMINTRFWDDNYTSNLDPIEKLMFLYFLTNTSTNISGIYEIPLKKIANETGIDKDMVIKIIERFQKDQKIFYVNGWVGIKNFIKNQNQRSITVQKGIQNELNFIPHHILNKMIEYGYPIDTPSYLNLIKSNIIEEKSETKVSPIKEENKELPNAVIESTLGFPKPEDWDCEYYENTPVWVCNGIKVKQSEINEKKKEFERQQKQIVTTAKATATRAETVTLFSTNAISLLIKMQGIMKLDGAENHKHAQSVKQKMIFDMRERKMEIPEDEIEMIHQLQLLLESVRKNDFHWRNLTSFAYFDKNFNKIIRDTL